MKDMEIVTIQDAAAAVAQMVLEEEETEEDDTDESAFLSGSSSNDEEEEEHIDRCIRRARRGTAWVVASDAVRNPEASSDHNDD